MAYQQPGQAQYGMQPIQTQPGAGGVQWMSMPSGFAPPPNCPPALAYLSTVDSLVIKQQLEVLEMFSGFETNNKYKITNNMGQLVFFAKEDNDCCTRLMCGPLRPFQMKIFDNARNEVISLDRPLACTGCCCYSCSHQSLEVCCPPGNPIGTIEAEFSFMTPKFAIKDASGSTVLKIKGPTCTINMCGTIEFDVLTSDGQTPIGKITKEWAGFGKELFTDSDTFGVQFPMDLDAKVKATLLGAVFLIDFLYYEKSNN